jgi:hypothetical protein
MIEMQAIVILFLVVAVVCVIAGNKGTINVSLNIEKPFSLPTFNPTSNVKAVEKKNL